MLCIISWCSLTLAVNGNLHSSINFNHPAGSSRKDLSPVGGRGQECPEHSGCALPPVPGADRADCGGQELPRQIFQGFPWVLQGLWDECAGVWVCCKPLCVLQADVWPAFLLWNQYSDYRAHSTLLSLLVEEPGSTHGSGICCRLWREGMSRGELGSCWEPREQRVLRNA